MKFVWVPTYESHHHSYIGPYACHVTETVAPGGRGEVGHTSGLTVTST